MGQAGRQKPQCTQSSIVLLLRRMMRVEAGRLGRFAWSERGPWRQMPPTKAARVEDAVGIEAALDFAHQRKRIGLAVPHVDAAAKPVWRLQDDDAAAGARRRGAQLVDESDRAASALERVQRDVMRPQAWATRSSSSVLRIDNSAKLASQRSKIRLAAWKL